MGAESRKRALSPYLANKKKRNFKFSGRSRLAVFINLIFTCIMHRTHLQITEPNYTTYTSSIVDQRRLVRASSSSLRISLIKFKCFCFPSLGSINFDLEWSNKFKRSIRYCNNKKGHTAAPACPVSKGKWRRTTPVAPAPLKTGLSESGCVWLILNVTWIKFYYGAAGHHIFWQENFVSHSPPTKKKV